MKKKLMIISECPNDCAVCSSSTTCSQCYPGFFTPDEQKCECK